MRTTLNLDDSLMAKAKRFFNDEKPGELVNRALRELIERESARRLADLGGSEPSLVAPPRRGIVADGDYSTIPSGENILTDE